MTVSEKENQPSILLVDDDPAVIKQLTEDLSAANYSVLSACDSHVAMAMLEKERLFQLIITDIIMPGRDGLSMIKQIRSKPRTRRIPIMVLSSAHDAATVARALEAGAIDYLAKPPKAEDLLARVNRALQRGSVTVLVIDDNLVILDLVGKVVSREGFQTHLVTNAEDGLIYFKEKRVDAIISDIKLPGMNGLEFLVAVKEIRPKIPVLLITGASAQFTRKDAIAAGADGYITKPFKNTEIASKLNSLLY